jgi:hypothetical protein
LKLRNRRSPVPPFDTRFNLQQVDYIAPHAPGVKQVLALNKGQDRLGKTFAM